MPEVRRLPSRAPIATLLAAGALILAGLPFATRVAASGVDMPIASDDHPAAVSENVPIMVDVLANDSDPGGETLAVGLGGEPPPSHGKAVVNSNQSVTYTPATNWFGNDEFGYTTTNTDGNSASATVFVTVHRDKPPVFSLKLTPPHFKRADGQVSALLCDPNGGPVTYTARLMSGPKEQRQAVLRPQGCETVEFPGLKAGTYGVRVTSNDDAFGFKQKNVTLRTLKVIKPKVHFGKPNYKLAFVRLTLDNRASTRLVPFKLINRGEQGTGRFLVNPGRERKVKAFVRNFGPPASTIVVTAHGHRWVRHYNYRHPNG